MPPLNGWETHKMYVVEKLKDHDHRFDQLDARIESIGTWLKRGATGVIVVGVAAVLAAVIT